MKLRATDKASNAKNPQQSVSSPATEQKPDASQSDTLTQTLQIRCNTLLYTTLQNMIASMHTAGDFSYTSVADVIRAAIQAYKDGMTLTEQAESGSKKATTVRVTDELADFYESWPNRMRTTILERAIRSHIKNM